MHCNNAIVVLTIPFVISVARNGYRHSWLSQGTILVSSHKTMSTVVILVRNAFVKITDQQ